MVPPDPTHEVATLLDEAGSLRRLAAAILRGGAAADVDDVVQDAWVAALTERGVRRGRAWIATVVQRLAFTVLRRRARREARERTVARPEAVASAAEVGTRLALHRAVVTAVESLDELQRDAVLRRYFDGSKPQQIADDLGVPVATVKTRLRRALVELRARLKREWGEEFGAALLALARPGAPAGGVPVAVAAGVAGALVMTMKTKLLIAGALLAVALAGAELLRTSSRRDGAAANASVTPPAPRVAATVPSAPVAAAPDVARVAERLPSGGPPPVASAPRRIGAIAGVVRGPRGEPVAAATVELLRRIGTDVSSNLPEHFELTQERRTTTSDADGRFRFDEVPRSSLFSLRALAEPALRGKGLSHLRAGDENVVVELEPAASVAGRVVDGDGEPVPDATVVVNASGAVRNGRLSVKAKTDENGEFALADLAPCNATVFAITPSGNVRFPEFVPLKAGEQAHVELTVDGPYGVDGVVVDDATGAPIADADVMIGLFEGEPIARSDRQGRFQVRTFETWQGGEPLEIHARGYALATVRSLAEKRIVSDCEVRMKRGRSARGRIVDASGLPVANAIVGVKPVCSGSGNHLFKPIECAMAKSAADGTFTVTEIGRDGSHVLLVRGDECADTVLSLPADEADRDELDLGDVVVDRGTLVTGRVLDDAGAVVLRPSLQLRTAESAEPAVPREVALYAWRELEVERDGRFVIPGVARGRWVLHAATSSHPTAATTEFVVDGRSDALEVDCRLDAGLVLAGRVRDEHDVAVPIAPHVTVSAMVEGSDLSGFGRQTVGADGRFRLTGLSRGPYGVRIYQDGAHDAGTRWLEPITLHGVTPGGAELDLVMRECVPCRIKVVDENGVAISGARVRFLDDEQEERADGRSGKEGEMTVGLVATRSYRMEVWRKWTIWGDDATRKPDLVRAGVRGGAEELVVELPSSGS